VSAINEFALVIHGGAGVVPRERMTSEREASCHDALDRALSAGETVLSADGDALDAVTAAVCALEDEPLFNAGRGAVFTRDGRQEMDASIMDGRDRRAGAVAGVFGPKNPVLLARCVMERSRHVLLIGEGALALGREAGLDFEDAGYFFTQDRWDSLQETLRMEATGSLDDDASRRHGTVGAVARDRAGNLAAATSTGGMTAKRSGRVGDSPVIGAGTFADNRSCAVSATGDGEVFLRLSVAHEIDARMRLVQMSLDHATRAVMSDISTLGGSGGLVAVAHDGSIAAPFNSEGMYRGWCLDRGARGTRIF
jgi:beta-aspartyl-peptidase (threonine type)